MFEKFTERGRKVIIIITKILTKIKNKRHEEFFDIRLAFLCYDEL